MNLISQRPNLWNGVVGQERVLTVLQSTLQTAKFMPRGFIFQGIRGLGKTSVAYIFARALMCQGTDPLGCGHCASCLAIAEHGIEAHPDFKELDAASLGAGGSGADSKVEACRELMSEAVEKAILGKRRVIVLDEAQRLSPDAWDVFLKPLEQGDSDTVFIFATTNGDRIPATVQSRCSVLLFSRVGTEAVLGLLANMANRNGIKYELDALKIIAGASKGIIREALSMLNTVASMGTVTKQLVLSVLDSLEDDCLKVLLALSTKNLEEAVRLVDEVGTRHSAAKTIETLLSLYARSPFKGDEPAFAQVYRGMPNTHEVSSVFLKWMATPYLSPDVLPLVVYELLGSQGSTRTVPGRSMVAASTASAPATPAIPSELELFAQLTGAKLVK